MAGYSGKTLVEKLGIKPGMKVAILGAPKGYSNQLGKLPAFVRVAERGKDFDVVQYFVTSTGKLQARLPVLARMIKSDGMIWISWPKQSTGVKMSLTENVVRGLALQHDLVDIKVAAIDEMWSALKLVIPRSLRDQRRDAGVTLSNKRVVV